MTYMMSVRTLLPNFAMDRIDGIKVYVFSDKGNEETASEVITAYRSALSPSTDVEDFGRGVVERFNFRGKERAVLRIYRRGGWIARFVERTFFKPGHQPRPLLETSILRELFEKGLPVVQPLAAVVEPILYGLLYRGAIVTAEVANSQSLYLLVHEKRQEFSDEQIHAFALKVGRAARSLSLFGVLHRDLHPGNVLVTSEGRIVLIDFDRARRISGPQSARIREQLKVRWERFCHKHCPKTADLMIDGFNEGMREETGSCV